MCVLQELPPPASSTTTARRVLAADPGSLVQLDLGTTMLVTDCDDGDAVIDLARRYPRSLIAGIADSNWQVDRARRNATRAGVGNVWFEAGDVTTQRFGAIFHLVLALTPDVPAGGLLPHLSSLHRSLRRQGTLFFQPPAGTVSHRLLEAGFDQVRTVLLPDDPARPLFIARR